MLAVLPVKYGKYSIQSTEDDSRMQNLHEKLASQEIIWAEGFDPALVIQEIRRIFLELGQLRMPSYDNWMPDTRIP